MLQQREDAIDPARRGAISSTGGEERVRAGSLEFLQANCRVRSSGIRNRCTPQFAVARQEEGFRVGAIPLWRARGACAIRVTFPSRSDHHVAPTSLG